MQPTWGLDVGAAEFVHKEADCGKRSGSRSPPNIQRPAGTDRNLRQNTVMYSGEIDGIIDRPTNNDIEKIGLLMARE